MEGSVSGIDQGRRSANIVPTSGSSEQDLPTGRPQIIVSPKKVGSEASKQQV